MKDLYYDNLPTPVEFLPTNNIVKLPIVGNLREGISYPIAVRTKVTDSDGNPLENVNVYLKSNPKIGAITSSDGNVTINSVEFDEIVVFQYQGSILEKMAGSILPTTKLSISWDLPEVVLEQNKPTNWWLWLTAAVVIIGGYKYFYSAKDKKYIKAKL